MMWEDIQQISTDSSSTRNLGENHERPRCGQANDGKLFLESLAVEDHGSDTESTWDPHSPKTVLWVVLSVMGLDVEVAEEIVEEMTPDFSYNCSNNWCQIEEGSLGIIEEVGWWTNELRDGCDDTNGPGEENQDIQTWSRVSAKSRHFGVKENPYMGEEVGA
jgi:hypothetical protein